MSGLAVKAWAKVNLSLEVLGKRPDGFHEVRTVMQSIEIADDLFAERAAELTLASDHETLAGEDNLVVRAAELLQRERGQSLGAAMRLRKRIPVAAGLGGGSADAAAALVVLEQLWGPRISANRLTEIAAMLGSDVPFFLQGGTALALGRGEEVRLLARSLAAWLVLLIPPHGLAEKTRTLYGSLGADGWSSGERTLRLAEAISSGRSGSGDLMVNCFEPIASRLFPELASYRASMMEAGASRVHLSGAGPTLFCLVPSEQEASAIAARLLARGYKPLVARTLSQGEARPQPQTAAGT